MWTILALALSARSSLSPHTLSKAFESGSRTASCVRMRQKSLRGIGPCQRRALAREEAGTQTKTHLHLEDSADAVDRHPDEILPFLICDPTQCQPPSLAGERVHVQFSSSISTSERRPWHETNI